MTLSCFADKAAPPDEAALTQALGKALAVWTALVAQAQALHGPLEPEWAFAGKAFGWSFRLRQPKRVLLYLTPQQGFFHVGIVLGERAAAAALADESLPEALRQDLAAARVYAEGRGIRLQLRRKSDLAPVLRLLEHKTRP